MKNIRSTPQMSENSASSSTTFMMGRELRAAVHQFGQDRGWTKKETLNYLVRRGLEAETGHPVGDS